MWSSIICYRTIKFFHIFTPNNIIPYRTARILPKNVPIIKHAIPIIYINNIDKSSLFVLSPLPKYFLH